MKAALVTRSVFVCYLFHPRPSSSPELGRYPFAADDAADDDDADDDAADDDDADDDAAHDDAADYDAADADAADADNADYQKVSWDLLNKTTNTPISSDNNNVNANENKYSIVIARIVLI